MIKVNENRQKDAPQNAINTLLSSLFAPLENDITDFEINSNGTAYKYYQNGKCKQIPSPLTQADITLLAYLLGGGKKEDISDNSPSVSSRVSLNNRSCRLEILLPPSVEMPSLSLRFYVFNSVSLSSLYDTGMFDIKTKELLESFISKKYNILISGATGSGKTTLLTALVNTIPQTERLIIIEDLQEIDCSLPNYTRILTNINTGFDGTSAIIRTLRMRPDRIIYGEVRTSAAFDLLDAWSTGHSGGLGTIHASSCKEALDRISKLASRKSQNISYDICKDITQNAVDVVIQIGFLNHQRRIIDIYNKHDKENI